MEEEEHIETTRSRWVKIICNYIFTNGITGIFTTLRTPVSDTVIKILLLFVLLIVVGSAGVQLQTSYFDLLNQEY